VAHALPQARRSHPLTVSNERAVWIDVLRGASGLLVILAHAQYFARAAAGPSWDAAADTLLMMAVIKLNLVMSPLRMELMFLLSGMFVAHSLDKGSRRYIAGKFNHVVYPFLLWSLLNFALRESGSVLLKGEPVAWRNLAELLLGHAPPTWFLFDLAVFFLVTPWLRRLPLWSVLPALVGLSLLVHAWVDVRYADLFYHLVYFLCGDALVRRRWDLSREQRPWVLAGSALCLCVIAVLATQTGLDKNWIGYLPLVLGTLPLIAVLAAAIGRTPLARPLTYVGRNAVVFYVVHFTLFIALAHVLERFTRDGMVVFALLLAAGIAVPLALCVLRRQPRARGVDLLFSLDVLLARRRQPTVGQADVA
jgi:uncharacterized membrane protein YcfT